MNETAQHAWIPLLEMAPKENFGEDSIAEARIDFSGAGTVLQGQGGGGGRSSSSFAVLDYKW